jgi:hypothetical protein
MVVLTAYDISAEERQRLNGYVETIIKKAGDSREALLYQLRNFLDEHSLSGLPPKQGEREKQASSN